MLVDLRSDSAEELSALSAQFKQVTEDAVSQEMPGGIQREGNSDL